MNQMHLKECILRPQYLLGFLNWYQSNPHSERQESHLGQHKLYQYVGGILRRFGLHLRQKH